MGRPIYTHELLSDPDFVWLLETFKENKPFHTIVDNPSIPIVFISEEPTEQEIIDFESLAEALPYKKPKENRSTVK